MSALGPGGGDGEMGGFPPVDHKPVNIALLPGRDRTVIEHLFGVIARMRLAYRLSSIGAAVTLLDCLYGFLARSGADDAKTVLIAVANRDVAAQAAPIARLEAKMRADAAQARF